MATNPDGTNPEAVPCTLREADESIVEYIDYLHDRIQFLTEELEAAEQELLNLREGRPTSLGSEDGNLTAEEDIENISQYVRFLAYEFDIDRSAVKRVTRLLAEVLKEEVDDSEDLHNASLALWVILKQHEDIASG